VHPHHDEVASELRRWHTESFPELGITVQRDWFGLLSNADGPYPRVLLTVDDPALVARALDEATALLGADGFGIQLDDRERAARLEPALVAAGCRPIKSTTHLALVGELRAGPLTPGLSVEVVATEDDLARWASVNARELETRRRERPAIELWLARVDGEEAAVLGFYTGADQLAWNLATRVAFRHRRIARSLLARWAAAGSAAGVRSLVINADDPGRPADLYRRLGFVDEVVFHRRYEFGAPPP
jgi:hypothetical protein